MKKINLFLTAVISLLIFSSCKEDTPEPNNTDVDNTPSTYSFEDVSFSGQTTRMNQLSAIKAYVSTVHSDATVVLDTAKLLGMYRGENFDDASLNSSKNLKSKTADFFADNMIGFLEEAVETSSSTSTTELASSGTAGLIERSESNGSKRYVMVDAKGFEYVQVIEKGSMSVVFMSQALTNYLNADNLSLDDNTSATFEEGKGTELAHHWDEAYGYFTEALDFPASGTDRFWGNYSNGRNELIGTNESIGGAFRKGRQAIVDENRDEALVQAKVIQEEWTKLAAANVIHYFNDANELTNTGDRLHALSEAYGFLLGVKIGGGNVDSMLSTLEDTGLYDIQSSELTDYINTLASSYGLESVKGDL